MDRRGFTAEFPLEWMLKDVELGTGTSFSRAIAYSGADRLR